MPKPLQERDGGREEGHLEPETEQTSEAPEEAEPDSGLGESSVEGGEGQAAVLILPHEDRRADENFPYRSNCMMF